MFCPNCGNQVADSSKFCPSCGAKLAAAAAPQAAPVQEPAPQPVFKPEPEDYRQQAQQDFQQVQQDFQQPQQDFQQAFQQPQQAFQQTQQDYQQAYQQPQQDFQQPQQSWQPVPQPYQQDYQQAYQPSAAVPVEATKKRSAKKGILIGVGCLLLAALIGGGIWFLSRGGSRNKLLRAAANSLAELKSYTESLPNLNKIVENAEALSDSSTVHAEEEFSVKTSYNWDDYNYSSENRISIRMDTDKEAKTLQVEGTYAMEDMEIPFSIYLDQDQLQAASSKLLDDGEVLSLPLKDLAKQWNASALAEMTDAKLPEDLDLSQYQNFDLEAALEAYYGEDWTTFKNSIDTVKYEGTSPFDGKGTTYTVTWDKDALKRIYNKSGGIDELEDIDVDELDDLAKLDLNELVAQAVGAFLGSATEAMEDPLFYVEDDVLVGLYLKEKAEEAREITVRLLGEENPWERLTITYHEDCGSYTTDDIVNVKLKKTDSKLRLEVNYKHEDSDGEEYSEESGPYVLIYNDTDGRITVEAEGETPEEMPDIFLVPVDGGLRINMDMTNESDYYSNSTKVVYSVTNKIDKIAPLSSKPTDILKLTQQELEDLLQRIEEKVNEYMGY